MSRNELTPKEIEYKAIISAKLHSLASQKGATQVAVSKSTGIPVTTINGYFKGSRLPSNDNAQKLADYFGISIGELDPRFNSTPTPATKTADLDEDDVLFTYQGKPLTDEDKELIRRLMNGKE